MKRKHFPWWIYATLLVLLALFALAPLLGVVVADGIASTNGCNLSEGPDLVCMIGGSDWGQALYSFSVLTWFLLVTLPLAGGAFLVWLIVLIFHWVAYSRQQKLEQA